KMPLQPLQLVRRRPVVFRHRGAARLGELELLAGPLLVAAAHAVHADEVGGHALAVGLLGGVVGFGGDLELAGRQLAEQELGDRARPFVEVLVAELLGQHRLRVVPAAWRQWHWWGECADTPPVWNEASLPSPLAWGI